MESRVAAKSITPCPAMNPVPRFCLGDFWGLKARLNSARGNALGRRTFILRRRPERANHSVNKQRWSSSISYSFGMKPYFRCLTCPFRATKEKNEPFSQGVALGWHKLSLRDAIENIPSQKELMRHEVNNINKYFIISLLQIKLGNNKKLHKSGTIVELLNAGGIWTQLKIKN